jgi:hypothetical protein
MSISSKTMVFIACHFGVRGAFMISLRCACTAPFAAKPSLLGHF